MTKVNKSKFGLWTIMGPLLFFTLESKGDPQQSYRDGESFAKEKIEEMKEGKADLVPGFETDRPEESSIMDLHTQEQGKVLHERVTQKSQAEKSDDNSATSLLVETEHKRPHFKIEPATDPLFVAADKILTDPEEVLKVQRETEENLPPLQSVHECYEGGAPETRPCVMKRHIRLRDIIPQIKDITLSIAGIGGNYSSSYNILTNAKGGANLITSDFPLSSDLVPRVRSITVKENKSTASFNYPILSVSSTKKTRYWTVRRLFTTEHRSEDTYNLPSGSVIFTLDYTPLPTEADVIETIEDTCTPLEESTDRGECVYGQETILEGPASKKLDTLEIKRDWWHKTRTYECAFPSKNNCAGLRKKGCTQRSSVCHQWQGDRCLEWKQTFMCQEWSPRLNKVSLTGKKPFCLDGTCTDQSWTPNGDMGDALAKMSLLKEVKKEMGDFREGRVFKGDDMKCSKHCLSFSDCCSLKNGWGDKLKLTRCTPEEQLLAQKRGEGKCHLVGTYCSKKVLGQCTLKKTTFCCYGSKLARLMHEQGRSQLGVGWGDPEHPNCRALSMEEFARIDWNKVNFSEIIQDVMLKVKVPDVSKTVQTFQDNWKSRLPSSAESGSQDYSKTLKNQLNSREEFVRKNASPGSYSLHGSPPSRKDREEDKAQVVF
ncbi:MAG: conjugal transfer protein TraN [Alphaproteobacteria bacterium]